MAERSHYQVIVIGIGSMGSSACCFLAQRGVQVLGLEQFGIVHENGSHNGQSRIIRKAYFEHPDYVPLLQRAYDNWEKLAQECGAEVYHRTGIVYFGHPTHDTMRGIKRSGSLYNIQLEVDSAYNMQKQFPMFKTPHDFEALFEPDAGFVTPERAIRLYTSLAEKSGATILTNQKVKTWREEGQKIIVETHDHTYTADKLIITAGSWTSKLVPMLRAELKVTRQTLAWVKPIHSDAFTLGNFPCWFIEDPELGMFYGFPMLPPAAFEGPAGLKLAHHRPGNLADPDLNSQGQSKIDEENIRNILSRYFNGVEDQIIATKTCLYTYSKDENFIIDNLSGYNNVIVACGFSGHGFKFVSIVGEVLADLAMKGKTDLPVDFLKLSRFKNLPDAVE